MTIACTKAEKEMIVLSMSDGDHYCPFDETQSVVCYGVSEVKCKKCIETNIEWEITDA